MPVPDRSGTRWLRRLALLFVATAGLQLSARSQVQFRFHHLTVNDGLSQGSINAIAQDSLGFMWFGTNDGLTRYDGYALQSFRPDPVDSSTAHDHVITSLLGHGPHTLWIGMRQGGIRRMDLRTFEIQQVRMDPPSRKWRSSQIVQLYADHRGTVWALSADALLRYDHTNDHFEKVPFAAFEPGWVGGSMAEDRSGGLWVALYEGGLWHIPPDRQTWSRVTYESPLVPDPERHRLRRVMLDRRNTLWIGSNKTLVSILEADRANLTRPLRVSSVEPFAAPHVLAEEGGRIWFTSGYQSMSVVDPVTGSMAGLEHVAQVPSSVSPGNLISAGVDRGGVVWLGSSGYGVNRLATSYRRFPALTLHAPLSFRSIRAITKDRRGGLWIGGYPYGTAAGLDRIDRATGAVRSFVAGKGRWQLPEATVWSLVEDPDSATSSMWVGCGATLTRLHFLSGRSEVVARIPSAGGGIRGMTLDRNQRLWVGSQRGLFRWDPASRLIGPARLDTSASDPLAVGMLRTSEILQIADLDATPGRIWCATTEGMACYDPATGRAVAFRQDSRPDGLRTSNIQSIQQDDRGDVWIATGGSGFGRMTLSPGLDKRMPTQDDVTFRFFDSKDGLLNDFAYAVLPGNDGALWISTNRGIARFDRTSERFRHFDVSDGLQDNEFNGGAHHRAADGELFFGGVVGVNHFYPNRLQDNPNLPAVVITECRLWGDEARRIVQVPFLEEIVANADEHTVMFDFVGLEYTAPERNRYRYQLEGFNRSWIESGTERTATYTNLEPGTYTFRVTASNNDGVWNPAGASIRLVVLPPFWESVWFRATILLAVAGIWVAGVWFRGRRMAARNRELEQRVRERTAEWEAANSELEAFSYTVSHDLRAPVRAINGYTRMLMEEYLAHLPPDAQRMLNVIATRTKRMGDMIDDLLTFSRMGRQAIIHGRIEMNDLVRSVAADLVPADARVSIVVQDLPPVTGDNALIRQVWINLIDNAVKFSSGVERPSITITGRTEADGVVYSIKDNGVGFDMTYRHKLFGVFERLHSQDEFEGSGVGLAIVARVIKRHGGRIWAESGPGQGATFSFELPIIPPASA